MDVNTFQLGFQVEHGPYRPGILDDAFVYDGAPTRMRSRRELNPFKLEFESRALTLFDKLVMSKVGHRNTKVGKRPAVTWVISKVGNIDPQNWILKLETAPGGASIGTIAFLSLKAIVNLHQLVNSRVSDLDGYCPLDCRILTESTEEFYTQKRARSQLRGSMTKRDCLVLLSRLQSDKWLNRVDSSLPNVALRDPYLRNYLIQYNSPSRAQLMSRMKLNWQPF